MAVESKPEPRYVLVICTANICRSPMAAALLQHALAAQPEPLRSLKVVSAGIAARPGIPATDHSVVALRKVGIDISRHASQPATEDLVRRAVLTLGMTESHRDYLDVALGPPPQRVHLFREWVGNGKSPEIPDPYGGPFPLYEAARDEMVEAIPSIIAHLKTLRL